SDAYFASRPRGSRLSAWASPQSTVVASRAELDDALAATERRFAEREVDRPAFWGGFRLVPERLEFWQGRRNRTHDRIAYLRAAAGWNIVRLAP
ncbi:MAG: pyridoxamine 5'-phosphate oxidase, partial [Candidatus Eremiobacteraeota bacterium]|nr:pyridoxamine 5'-phosphate oxidase [Candidatus Eremiobacteraeota bacterium]